MWKRLIQEATECPNADVEAVEDMMRDVVYKSTLDWQTRDELIEAARLAHRVLKLEREQRV